MECMEYMVEYYGYFYHYYHRNKTQVVTINNYGILWIYVIYLQISTVFIGVTNQLLMDFIYKTSTNWILNSQKSGKCLKSICTYMI